MAKRKATYTYLGEEFILTTNKYHDNEIRVTDVEETAVSYIISVVNGFVVSDEKWAADGRESRLFDNLTDALDCACANVICVRDGVRQMIAFFDNAN